MGFGLAQGVLHTIDQRALVDGRINRKIDPGRQVANQTQQARASGVRELSRLGIEIEIHPQRSIDPLTIDSSRACHSSNRLLDSCGVSQIIMSKELEVVIEFLHQRNTGGNV